MINIRCPYCLKEISLNEAQTYKCSNPDCGEYIPRDFVEKREIPRATVGLIGFRGHGKTTYITSLFYLLKFFKTKWEGYYFLTLDDHTGNIIYEHVPQFEEKSSLPDGTPANFPRPALIRFYKVPYFKDYFLSVYDTGGEVFTRTEQIMDQGRFVAHSDTVLFIFSINDLGERWSDNIEKLLDIYIRAVYDKMRVDLKKRQHLIIVLTKADTLKNTTPEKQLSEELINYLDTGTYLEYLLIDDKYINKKLKYYSRIIRNWLKEKGCQGFISAAEDNFKSVEYTIVSSTGAAPVGKKLAKKLEPQDPKRVLDPFLWILEKNRPKKLLEKLFGGR